MSGMLRIDFQGGQGILEPITWESFFEVFDYRHFFFLYQETTGTATSRFYSILSRTPSREHPHPVREALTETNRRFGADAQWIDEVAHKLEEGDDLL